MDIGNIRPQVVSLGQFYQEEAPTLRIPTIQRQFVWDPEDVKELVDSILNGYPIGAIIIWEPTTRFPSAPLMGTNTKTKAIRYILDGQQRLTALMLMMNGWEIQRGDKTIRIPTISYRPETRKLYVSEKMGIDLSLIVKAANADAESLKILQKDYPSAFTDVIEAVGKRIVQYQLPVYVLKSDSGQGKDDYLRIAEIFTRINRAGVKIGNLEMFLSFFAAAFPQKDKDKIISMHEAFDADFDLDLEPLMRFVFSEMGTTQNQVTQVPSFMKSISTLRERYSKDVKAIGAILEGAERAAKTVLGLMAEEFGIASTQLIPSQNALLPLFHFAYRRGFSSYKAIPTKQRNRMLHWFLVASFNSVYSSSANRRIDDDLTTVSGGGMYFPTVDLLAQIRKRTPGRHYIRQDDLVNARTNVLRGRIGKEYLMVLDVLLHRNEASNWAGHRVKTEEAAVHHIFPREFLRQNGETKDDVVNCLANLTFIAPEVNSEIGDTPPDEYLKAYVGQGHDILERHMIPTDPRLWKVENFESFLLARERLIWKATSALVKKLAI